MSACPLSGNYGSINQAPRPSSHQNQRLLHTCHNVTCRLYVSIYAVCLLVGGAGARTITCLLRCDSVSTKVDGNRLIGGSVCKSVTRPFHSLNVVCLVDSDIYSQILTKCTDKQTFKYRNLKKILLLWQTLDQNMWLYFRSDSSGALKRKNKHVFEWKESVYTVLYNINVLVLINEGTTEIDCSLIK